MERAKPTVEIAIEANEDAAVDYLENETQVEDSRNREVTR
jgi:hypothetical protein